MYTHACVQMRWSSIYRPPVQLLPVQWKVSIRIWPPFPLNVPACFLGSVLHTSRLTLHSSLLWGNSVDTSAPTWTRGIRVTMVMWPVVTTSVRLDCHYIPWYVILLDTLEPSPSPSSTSLYACFLLECISVDKVSIGTSVYHHHIHHVSHMTLTWQSHDSHMRVTYDTTKLWHAYLQSDLSRQYEDAFWSLPRGHYPQSVCRHQQSESR